MQELVVGLIVVAAALYLLGKYLPRTLRAPLAGWLARRRWGASLARWLDGAAGNACGGGCSSCGPAAPAKDPRGKHRVIKLHQRH